ncbi:MAG: murein biosynthesis integral membrane protein MurJ, partial [bacterium]
GIVYAEHCVTAIAPGFRGDPAKFAVASRLTRVMFPCLVFIGLGAVATGILNSARRFFVPALSSAALNVAMIGALLAGAGLASGREAIVWLGWGVVAGGLLQLAIQLPLVARVGAFPLPAAPWRTLGMGRVLALMGPAAFGVAILQINILIDRLLASFLIEGSVSHLYYANRLVQFPHGLLSLAVTTAVFPVLSSHAAARAEGELRGALAQAGRLTLFITLPATFGLLALAPSIIEVLFERDAFGAAQTAASAGVLRAYALGLVFFGIIRFLGAAFHARQDTRYPVRCANAGVAANVVLSLALMLPLGAAGLALATSLASALNAALLIRGMRRTEAAWPGAALGRAARQLLLPAAAAGAAVFAIDRALWPHGASTLIRALWLFAEIAAAAGLYFTLSRLFAPDGYVPLRALLRRGADGASGPKEG